MKGRPLVKLSSLNNMNFSVYCSFKTPVLGGGSPALTSPPSGAAVRRPAAREEELRAREDTARRKEKWIRDLDAELDRWVVKFLYLKKKRENIVFYFVYCYLPSQIKVILKS